MWRGRQRKWTGYKVWKAAAKELSEESKGLLEESEGEGKYKRGEG